MQPEHRSRSGSRPAPRAGSRSTGRPGSPRPTASRARPRPARRRQPSGRTGRRAGVRRRPARRRGRRRTGCAPRLELDPGPVHRPERREPDPCGEERQSHGRGDKFIRQQEACATEQTECRRRPECQRQGGQGTSEVAVAQPEREHEERAERNDRDVASRDTCRPTSEARSDMPSHHASRRRRSVVRASELTALHHSPVRRVPSTLPPGRPVGTARVAVVAHAVFVVGGVHLEAPRGCRSGASKVPLNFTVVPEDVVPSTEKLRSAPIVTVPL